MRFPVRSPSVIIAACVVARGCLEWKMSEFIVDVVAEQRKGGEVSRVVWLCVRVLGNHDDPAQYLVFIAQPRLFSHLLSSLLCRFNTHALRLIATSPSSKSISSLPLKDQRVGLTSSPQVKILSLNYTLSLPTSYRDFLLVSRLTHFTLAQLHLTSRLKPHIVRMLASQRTDQHPNAPHPLVTHPTAFV